MKYKTRNNDDEKYRNNFKLLHLFACEIILQVMKRDSELFLSKPSNIKLNFSAKCINQYSKFQQVSSNLYFALFTLQLKINSEMCTGEHEKSWAPHWLLLHSRVASSCSQLAKAPSGADATLFVIAAQCPILVVQRSFLSFLSCNLELPK